MGARRWWVTLILIFLTDKEVDAYKKCFKGKKEASIDVYTDDAYTYYFEIGGFDSYNIYEKK